MAFPPFDGSEPINDSGTGLPAPPEVRRLGYCWGAFAFPWWFSIANNIPLGCLFGGSSLYQFWIARRGHEEAWKHRHFQSFAEFERTMRVWNRWGKVHLVVMGLFFVFAFTMSLGTYATFGDRDEPVVDEDQAVSQHCFETVQKLARACEIYGYDTDGRLPPAKNWETGLGGLMPGHQMPQCLSGARYLLNPNAAGRKLGAMPERAVVIYEGDAQGRRLYPHQGSAHGVGGDGGFLSLCREHQEEAEWLGKAPERAPEPAAGKR